MALPQGEERIFHNSYSLSEKNTKITNAAEGGKILAPTSSAINRLINP